ncbi:MAG: hypothetical protein ACYSWZ_07020 [Planctomycetota bacterium]|jgi:hypothetical protein
MKIVQGTRRQFLKTMVAGAAFLALPGIPRIAPKITGQNIF